MKRALALILALVMTMALVACGGDKTTTSTPSTSTPATTTPSTTEPSKPAETPTTPTEPAKPAEPKILHLTSKTAAASALSLVSTSDADTEIQSLIQGYLYGNLPIDGKAVLTGLLADGEPVDVNGDGKTWNVKINKNAKWENGEAINADTVIFSWKVALDPKLVLKSGSTAAKDYAEIVNALGYYNQGGEGKTPVAWEDVGIKKIDDYTVQFVLAGKTTVAKAMRQIAKVPMVYQPLWEKCLSADGTTTTYATAQDKVMAAGAFKLTKWVIGSVREFEKNENWTCADYIKLDGITYQIVEDDNTRIMMYEKGELDWTTLTIDAAKQYEDDPRLLHWQSNYSHVIDFCTTNTDKPFLASENFRLAIFYGLDRVTMAKVSGGAPATGIISPNAVAYADGTSYRNLAASNGVDPANYGYDPVKAVAYFEKALQECGLDKIEVTLLAHSNSAIHVASAEFMQESLSEVFGKDRFKMNLDMQPSATANPLKKSWTDNPKAYEMTISSWSLSAQNYDPVLALSPYTSSRASRNAPMGYAELDELWAKLSLDENLLDEKNRAAIAMEFEKAIVEHAYTVPFAFGLNQGMVNDRVIMPLDEYSVDLGWAWRFCDIAQ